jgi:polar amino acid transport system permease protein
MSPNPISPPDGQVAVDRRGDAPQGTSARLKIVPVRHYGQWLVAAVVVVLVGFFVSALITSRNIDWPTFGQYVFDEQIMHGIVTTVQIAVVAFCASAVCGLALAVCRLSGNPVLRTGAALYVWFFRAIPLILLIFLLGNLALLFPNITIGVPGTDIVLLNASTNSIVTVFLASVIAITIHDAALSAEIIRGAIIGIPRGQSEAAKALGLNSAQTLRKVVVPQALRTMIPPMANQFVLILKQTSLVAVIAGGDLMTEVANIYAVNFRTIELLFVAAFWYLLLVSVASLGQSYLESRSNRGDSR